MTTINCAEACVNGCVLGDECPHREYQAEASKFIQETSMDQMIEMASARIERLRRRAMGLDEE